MKAFLDLLAQVSSDSPLLAYGPLGIICAWFMWRGEKLIEEIRTLSHRIDGITRAMLVDVVSRDNAGPNAKKTAEEMLHRIEARDLGKR